MTIRVEQIRIENVFGVKELEFDPDGVTVIRGDNDTGKTSVLRAINLLLTGGQDPEALHKDADSGRVEFRLSDGTRVWASLTENKIHYKVDGRPDLTARQLLTSIQDEVSINPIQILRARPQDRGQILLEAMPMRVDNDTINEATEMVSSEDWGDLPNVDLDRHALDVIGDPSSGAIGTLYEQRQSLHGAKRDKEGTVNDLKEAVGDYEDPSALKDERREAREKANSLREDMQADLDEAEEEKDDQIKQVNTWEKREIEKIREEANQRREKARQGHQERTEAVREKYEPKIEEAQKSANRLDEKVGQAERAQQTKETLEKRKEELEDLSNRYDALTEAIENLRSLKTDFQDDLPSDVTIDEDGEIVNSEGIRFENWNEQSQVQFALRIAEMRMGELAIIPLDGIEKIVGEQREILIRFCKDSPAQFILTEAVPDESLTVNHV